MTIERICKITNEIANIMKRSFDGDDEIIINQINNGRARLWKYQDTNKCGYFVTRVDYGTELCLVAGESIEGMWLFESIMPAIEKMAEFFGCQSIRFHTKRKGFKRYSKKLGFIEQEIIYSKKLYGKFVEQQQVAG